jgi:hypothetical protein
VEEVLVFYAVAAGLALKVLFYGIGRRIFIGHGH